MVWTVEPTLAVGCHFYSWVTMSETATWRWNDRTLGQTISNTDGTSAEIWLHPMLLSLYFDLLGERPSEVPESVRQAMLQSRPTPKDVAALVTMARFPDLFGSHSNMPTNNASRRAAQDLHDQLVNGRECSAYVAGRLTDHLRSNDPSLFELSVEERRAYVEAIDCLAEEYLAKTEALRTAV